MVRKMLLLLTLIVVSVASRAQEKDVYMPRELQQAYEEGTRSHSGKPGPNYFQNSASYDIQASFRPESGLLEGSEQIQYRNNSPDTLDHLVFRVFMNIFQKGVERDFGVGPADLHEGVDINNLTVDGRQLGSKGGPRLLRGSGTVYVVGLSEPLMPGESKEISLDWEVELPTHVTVRMGKYGEANNWFVGYWYPHISVYDDVYGWDTHPFTGSAEFYYDFNDYDVRLTLPGEYMVWATGLLQDPSQYYQKPVLDRIQQAKTTDEVVPIAKAEDLEKGQVLTDRKEHTWHFKAQGVPDFSFAVSKEYIWDATSVEVDPQTGRRTFVSAVYDTGSRDFHEVAEISRETIRLLSEEIMGVPFAYPKLTAFNGSGGMEFAMMINDGDAADYQSTVHLTAHEIGHNYFPFYVMTNESYYAFMDEGLISFLPRMVEERLVEGFNPWRGLVQGYAANAGTKSELPLMVKSYVISDYPTYRVHAYQRPGTAFYLLRELVGDQSFHKALKAYIQRWAKKHPTPYDFFFTFEDVLGRDLSWFWKPWFFEFGYPDLAVASVNKAEGQHLITIQKKGNMPVPLHLKVTFEDGSQQVIEQSAEIWRNREEYGVKVSGDKAIEKIELGHENIPDSRPQNNIWQVK